jgi:hypothetical protein
MNIQSTYLVGLAVTLMVSLGVVLYLRRPLQQLLVDLCGSVERAGFWSTNSHILLILVPLMFAMVYRPSTAARQQGELAILLGSQLFLALLGLIGTILAQSLIINLFIPRASQR